MCTDRDCSIFRGKLIACDNCQRMSERMGAGTRMSGPGGAGCPKAPQMP